MDNTRIKIIVALHKPYRLPEDPMYLPLQVGRTLHPALPYAGDDTGENISEKNPGFCELTGLYWAWKNLDSKYIGLCHYRRYFAGRGLLARDPWQRVLKKHQAEKLLQKAPVILPRKRNYFIETNYNQYIHSHHVQDLALTRRIIAERHPRYLAAYDRFMKRTTGHHFNMFVMRRDLLDKYCDWLFDILFELERRLDVSGYTAYDRRVFGFVAERLLDPWVETNGIGYTELPVIHIEGQDWGRKIMAFLKRKYSYRPH